MNELMCARSLLRAPSPTVTICHKLMANHTSLSLSLSLSLWPESFQVMRIIGTCHATKRLSLSNQISSNPAATNDREMNAMPIAILANGRKCICTKHIDHQ